MSGGTGSHCGLSQEPMSHRDWGPWVTELLPSWEVPASQCTGPWMGVS